MEDYVVRSLRALRAVKASSDGSFGCSKKICVFKGTPKECTSYPCLTSKITCYDKSFKRINCNDEARKIAEVLKQDPSEDLDNYETYPEFAYVATGNPLQEFASQFIKGLGTIASGLSIMLNPIVLERELSKALSGALSPTHMKLYSPFTMEGLVSSISFLTNGKGGLEGRKEFARKVKSLFAWMGDKEKVFWARFLLRILRL